MTILRALRRCRRHPDRPPRPEVTAPPACCIPTWVPGVGDNGQWVHDSNCPTRHPRRAPSMPTLTAAGGRVLLGRPGSDRDPEDAVATLGAEEGEATALVDLTEADLVAIRDWIIRYVAALHDDT